MKVSGSASTSANETFWSPGRVLKATLGLASGLAAAALYTTQGQLSPAAQPQGLQDPTGRVPASFAQQVLRRPAPYSGPLPGLPGGPSRSEALVGPSRALQADDGYAAKAAPPRAFIMYSGWHGPNFREAQSRHAAGRPVHTVQEVLDSQGRLEYKDITFASVGAWAWHTRPLRGFYSIYTPRRPGQLHYNRKFDHKRGDPQFRAVLRQHAQQLAGFDGVVLDATNLSVYDEQSDELQLRPFENLVKVWAELRRYGRSTPNVAVWLRLPAPGTHPTEPLFRKFLTVMNAPAFRNMFVRDVTGKKMVVFYSTLAPANSQYVQELEANGGRHNIAAVPMGAHLNPAAAVKEGELSYLSACSDGTALTDAPCNQTMTANKDMGTWMSVAPSYQQSYAGLYGGATGIRAGLVLRRQFAEVLAQRPDNVFVASFNEHQAQMVPIMPGIAQAAAPMGFEADPRAANKTSVDLYGGAYSRDIEPTTDNGRRLLNIVVGCLDLYRQGAVACEEESNPCCGTTKASALYVSINAGTERAFGLAAPHNPPRRTQAPLYQCDSDGAHFARSADCDGAGGGQAVGHLSVEKRGATVRALLLCQERDSGARSISLLGTCPPETRLATVLGYVR